MTCNWCEENKKLIKYCKVEDHNVCEDCYEKYRAIYPLRIEGCPYCVGTQEKIIIYIIPTNHNNRIPYEVVGCLTICSMLCLGIITTMWFHILKIMF